MSMKRGRAVAKKLSRREMKLKEFKFEAELLTQDCVTHEHLVTLRKLRELFLRLPVDTELRTRLGVRSDGLVPLSRLVRVVTESITSLWR